jgi:hypothetical protein
VAASAGALKPSDSKTASIGAFMGQSSRFLTPYPYARAAGQPLLSRDFAKALGK